MQEQRLTTMLIPEVHLLWVGDMYVTCMNFHVSRHSRLRRRVKALRIASMLRDGLMGEKSSDAATISH